MSSTVLPEWECPSCGKDVLFCPCDLVTKNQNTNHEGLVKSFEEFTVTDPITGGKKGSKLARFSLIPQDWLWALAEHYGVGSRKYEDRNWEKGYKWSLSLDAHGRHLAQWLGGEDNDEETGSSHLVAAAWHLVALWWFHRHNKGTDDVRSQA